MGDVKDRIALGVRLIKLKVATSMVTASSPTTSCARRLDTRSETAKSSVRKTVTATQWDTRLGRSNTSVCCSARRVNIRWHPIGDRTRCQVLLLEPSWDSVSRHTSRLKHYRFALPQQQSAC